MGADCDAAVDQGPALTLPLTDADQRGGRTPWPTLPVQLKAISLQLRNGQAAGPCPGLEHNFNFDGDVLDNIENTVPESVGAGESFTLTCKNSSWILPTQANATGTIPNSATFTCVNTTVDPAPTDHHLDNWPLVKGKPCMAPCPANYTLYMPGPDTRAMTDVLDRVTCLSPPSTEPAMSAMDAATRCGEKGEQLLDFVPKSSFLPGLDTSQPHWIWLRPETNWVVTHLNSRDEKSGTLNVATFRCVQVDNSGAQPVLIAADCHSDWLGTNPYRNFVCMTAVGCGPDAVFHAGSCYKYLQSVMPSEHVQQCRTIGGTPADYTASFVAEALPQLGVPTDSPGTPLVGIYRRYGKFWRPDGSLVAEDEFDGGTYGDESLQCAAPLPTDPTKLTAIDCTADLVHQGVICQTAAHVSPLHDPCSVRYDQLLNASSAGPTPQLARTITAIPTATLGDRVTFTCPDGFNVHNLTDFHSIALTCEGFVSGWEYPAELDVELHGQPLQCIYACDLSESAKPQNTEIVTEGPDQLFRCLWPMQTASGSTEQLVVCDHGTGQLDAGSLQPCDHCLMSPLIPDENAGFTSGWDNVTRLEGTTVNYTCLSGLQTPAGETLQNQTCTANGWEGEVVPCSQCVPLDEDVQLRAALVSLEGPQLFGALANVSCPSNIESGNGSLSTSVICMPSGWSWCIDDFNCSYCSGSPPNASAMATMTSDWDGEQRTFNTTVLYTCSAGLETADGTTEQTANCTETGWQDGVLPCDVCSNPPNGSHPTISATQPTGEGTLGSSLKFVCNSGLSQADGATSILSVCTETGWTNCSDDIKCEYCTPLPHLPDGTMDWGSYTGERALGTEVTLTCGDGLAIPGSLEKTQKVVCDLDGWNHTAVQSCTVCDQEPPSPVSSMTLDWTLGDSQAVYQCPNDTMLPWGQTSYQMLCSPDGWSDCVPECSACVFPPPAGTGAVMTSQNVSRGGTANYECRAGMTSVGATELELTCTVTGWTEAEMITCDRCASEPAEAGPAQNRTGNVTNLIGNTLQYQCDEPMITADGLTEQSVNCSGSGWSEPPAPCDHCILPAAPNSTDQTWDLSANFTEGRVPVGTNITFFCSNVTSTLVSNSSNLTLSCGADGWSDEPEPCVSCLGVIPDPGNGTDARNVTWDGGRQEGALVLYTCQNGAQHEVVCTGREWLPALLGPCVVPTTEPTGEFDVVTKATYDDKYPITTNYYWATLHVNMTSTYGDDTWSVGKGPAGFEDSLILDSGCMSHRKWPSRRDECATNPANCEEGFSFSMWFRIEMQSFDTQFNDTVDTRKRYLLSTGGDDQGSPGIAIFVKGHALHALVSTGSQYWEAFVIGQLLSETWFNVGVRWSSTAPFEVPGSPKLPGLQLYINRDPMARETGPSAAKASVKEVLNPPEMMVGCHRTSDNAAYRDFCSGEFDEVAMWTRLLPANESIYFLGGFDERDKHITMDSMLDRLRRDPELLKSPKMFRAYIDQMQKAMKTDAAAAAVGSTAASGTAGDAEAEAQPAAVDLPEGTPVASPEEVGKVHALVQLVAVMTQDAKDPVTPDELPLFMSLLKVVGSSLNKDTLAQWRNIEYTYKEEGGAASVVVGFEDWVLKLGSNTDLGGLGDNLIHEQTEDNVELTMQVTAVYKLRTKPILYYPMKAKNRLNTVQVASDLFNSPDTPECRFVGVSMLYVFYNTLGQVSPQRYSTLDLHAETSDLALEGGVVSIKFALKSDDPGLVANCTPTAEKLRKYPIQTSIAHTTQAKAKRGILFHEDEINTGILRRACVWWNPTLSDYGGWDTDGCKAVDYSDFHTKCACAHFGQIAIMVQKEPPKIVDLEFMWLKIIKYICYTVSALLLIVFIAAVIKIKALHEMFHLMRLNTAIGLLLGSVLMVMTDIPEIRADRHTCTGFAGAIHFFYLLAATMVMLEGIADFISVTSGAIGGKLKSYVAFAWGVPFLSLGYAMLMHLPDYGTDPRCMLGWPDEVKMTMFMPLIVLLSFTFLMTCLVSCNMQASRLRKENIVAEQLTVCKGFVFFSFYFFCTWIVGLIAYLRLGLSIPSFYPLFQILNSTGGIIFFLFCGIGSERFWLLIAGKSDLRKKMLFSYTVTEQLSESKQNLVDKEPSRPTTPEDDQEEFDPEAHGPRGPIAA